MRVKLKLWQPLSSRFVAALAKDSRMHLLTLCGNGYSNTFQH